MSKQKEVHNRYKGQDAKGTIDGKGSKEEKKVVRSYVRVMTEKVKFIDKWSMLVVIKVVMVLAET